MRGGHRLLQKPSAISADWTFHERTWALSWKKKNGWVSLRMLPGNCGVVPERAPMGDVREDYSPGAMLGALPRPPAAGRRWVSRESSASATTSRSCASPWRCERARPDLEGRLFGLTNSEATRRDVKECYTTGRNRHAFVPQGALQVSPAVSVRHARRRKQAARQSQPESS